MRWRSGMHTRTGVGERPDVATVSDVFTAQTVRVGYPIVRHTTISPLGSCVELSVPDNVVTRSIDIVYDAGEGGNSITVEIRATAHEDLARPRTACVTPSHPLIAA